MASSAAFAFDMASSIGTAVANGNSLKEILEQMLKSALGRGIAGVFGGVVGLVASGGNPAGFGAGFELASGVDLGAENGANFTVPSGFPKDSFNLGVTSGEHVQVTPAGKVSMQEKQLMGINNRIDAMNKNLFSLLTRQPVIEASNNIGDRGLELTVRKSERRSARYR